MIIARFEAKIFDMKFTQEMPCACGGTFPISTYGDNPWPILVCPKCATAGNLMNSLSVSVAAERLFYHSKAELENGDNGSSIAIGTMAVESFLTRLFLKLKGMDSYATTFSLPTGRRSRHVRSNTREKAASSYLPTLFPMQ